MVQVLHCNYGTEAAIQQPSFPLQLVYPLVIVLSGCQQKEVVPGKPYIHNPFFQAWSSTFNDIHGEEMSSLNYCVSLIPPIFMSHIMHPYFL